MTIRRRPLLAVAILGALLGWALPVRADERGIDLSEGGGTISLAASKRIYLGGSAAGWNIRHGSVFGDFRLGLGGTDYIVFNSDGRASMTRTSTDTSAASFRMVALTQTLNPGEASSSTFYNLRSDLASQTGNANALGASASIRAQNLHATDAAASAVQGTHFLAGLGTLDNAAPATQATATEIFGLIANAWQSSAKTGATATRLAAIDAETYHTGPGTTATALGQHIGVGISNGGSGAGTIAQGYGLRVTGASVNGADILIAGTITNGSMLYVGDWSSGPTYTNPPIGIEVASQTASDAIALKTGTGKVSLGDKITTYNAIATVGNGVPSIVAQASGTAQTEAVPATALHIPAADGLYRVSAQLKVTTGAGMSSTLGAITIGFTDGHDSVGQLSVMLLSDNAGIGATTAAGNNPNTRLSGASTVIYADAGTAITYAIGYASNPANAMNYAYDIKLEAL